jgi:ATP-dependent DNA helicase RecG
VEFLSAALTPKQRATAAFNIEYGNAKIIIGTHSVLGKDIKYRDLTLVVTDEQHRFGVRTRGALENKAEAPDRIVMSATPIPRTLTLTLSGELELIAIRGKPKQSTVLTRFVGEKIPQMYDYIEKKAAAGEQTIIVCPRIEGDGELDITGAAALYAELKPRFGAALGLLHGRLKDAEKTDVMRGFIAGAVKVLVATSIVEVGIDVHAATTMVVYNAERYGLCQIHQLRGRVGRGDKDGYCFLLAGVEAYETRLKYLAECSDGFALAEKDFDLRGAGDFLGLRQHGASLTFTGEPVTLELLKLAKEISEQISPEDIVLPNDDTELFFKELALN